jgi:hypothetical protein
MKLVWKFTIPQLCLFFCLSLIGYLVINGLLAKMIETYTTDTANERIRRIHRNVSRNAWDAVRISSLFADMPVVRQAYSIAFSGNIDDPYSPQSQAARELLRAALKPVLDKYKFVTGEALKLHFHLPNYRSLTRLWREKQTRINGEWVDFPMISHLFGPRSSKPTAKERLCKA